MAGGVKEISRRLRDLCEPIAASVYFLPEAHEAYQELGCRGFAQGYFPSRGACLGNPSGQVICAAFGVFNPDIVLPAVEAGWEATDPASILRAREHGATSGLRRILGEAEPTRAVEILRPAMESVNYAGRALFSGLLSLDFPTDPLGQLWRACDYVRERRGDGHIAAWVSHGCDPVEISLLTELAWGLQLRTYVFTRGWTAEQVEAGVERLRSKGYLSDDDTLTDEGKGYRRSIEAATDTGEAAVVDAIGDKVEELFELLAPLQRAVLEAKAYPIDPGSTMNNEAL
jgi:hypothetical protein